MNFEMNTAIEDSVHIGSRLGPDNMIYNVKLQGNK